MFLLLLNQYAVDWYTFFKIEKHGNFLFGRILVIIGINLNFQRTWVSI